MTAPFKAGYAIARFLLFMISASFLFPTTGAALEPHEILVIANKNASRSIDLGKYYMRMRKIPEANFLQLWLTDKEWCSREEFNNRVVKKVRKHLSENDPIRQIRCLVTMYGIPLKVNPPEMTAQEKNQVDSLRKRLNDIRSRLKELEQQKNGEIKKLREESNVLEKRISNLTKNDQRSSFDSELALVLVEHYSLSGWIPNPYFLGFKNKKLQIGKENVLMVSRLDGPSEDTVKKIIKDCIQAEKNGLNGTAYFDARWPRPEKQKLKGPAFYDNSIHRAADLVRKSNLVSVVVNDTAELFQKGECPNAALYCGWYSLAKYVDAFTWQPGAVGYHIASGECTTLKSKDSRVWCKMMLEKGAAATIGPVNEPYVQAFPVPEIFFGLLVNDQLSLAECYILSIPYLSWQMVLVGDPLYRPFKNR